MFYMLPLMLFATFFLPFLTVPAVRLFDSRRFCKKHRSCERHKPLWMRDANYKRIHLKRRDPNSTPRFQSFDFCYETSKRAQDLPDSASARATCVLHVVPG